MDIEPSTRQHQNSDNSQYQPQIVEVDRAPAGTDSTVAHVPQPLYKNDHECEEEEDDDYDPDDEFELQNERDRRAFQESNHKLQKFALPQLNLTNIGMQKKAENLNLNLAFTMQQPSATQEVVIQLENPQEEEIDKEVECQQTIAQAVVQTRQQKTTPVLNMKKLDFVNMKKQSEIHGTNGSTVNSNFMLPLGQKQENDSTVAGAHTNGNNGIAKNSQQSDVIYDESSLHPHQKIRKFTKLCSEVLKGQVFLSGEEVAYNKEQLLENGITHVINCAGNVCPNKFPENFQYRTYFLKDSKIENIECIFYETNFYIEDALQSGGRVLIHCVQGVSRSVTICIAYLIWKFKYTYDQAFEVVKKARDIASPNAGFLVQAMNYYKRLCEPYDAITVKPRVFVLSSHEIEMPNLVVARMLLENLYDPKRLNRSLDSRGLFIIQTDQKFLIWVGHECLENNRKIYSEVALKYIELLKHYEHGGNEIDWIEEGEEPPNFWQLWGFAPGIAPQVRSTPCKEWDNWFLSLDPSKMIDNYESPHQYLEENKAEEEAELLMSQQKAPLLFVFPDSQKPHKMFDIDDLTEKTLCVMCKEEGNQLKQFVWRGFKVDGPEEIEHQFAQDIINNFFRERQFENILKFKEEPTKETEEFQDIFF